MVPYLRYEIKALLEQGENGWEKFYKIFSSSSEVVEQSDRIPILSFQNQLLLVPGGKGNKVL